MRDVHLFRHNRFIHQYSLFLSSIGKVLRGSDGRDYLLEMMRLTPRDANFVRGDKGTAKVAALEGACLLICLFAFISIAQTHGNEHP